MLISRLAVSAAMMFASPAVAQSVADAVTEYELDNGMQVIVVEDHRAPVVQHMVWYPRGSVGRATRDIGRRAFSGASSL